jgi:hypothetical protein
MTGAADSVQRPNEGNPILFNGTRPGIDSLISASFQHDNQRLWRTNASSDDIAVVYGGRDGVPTRIV